MNDGTVGRFIMTYFISNSYLLVAVNILLAAKISNLVASIKILNKYKEDKSKEVENNITELTLKYIGLQKKDQFLREHRKFE